MGAAGAAAILFKREKDLVAHFRSHGAIDSAHAMSPVALGVETRLAWELLHRGAIIRDGAPGTFYLDELSWEAMRSRRKRLLVIVLCIVLVMALVPFIAATIGEIAGAGHKAAP
jgi:hypothetical protein